MPWMGQMSEKDRGGYPTGSLADEVSSIVFAFDSGDSRRDAVRELADRVSSLEAEFAEARAAQLEFERTRRALNAVLAVLERGPRYTDRHLEAAADSVVEEIREAIALASGEAMAELLISTSGIEVLP